LQIAPAGHVDFAALTEGLAHDCRLAASCAPKQEKRLPHNESAARLRHYQLR
jgi:hypothetical protein